MSTILAWLGRDWAERSNRGACTNARTAAVLISRARVERGEVERYVAGALARRTGAREGQVGEMPHAGEPSPVTTGAPSPRRRAVIAEDEALIRLDLKEMLQEEGYDVAGEAGDGERAVELARELKPDLVVLDIKMPRLDGIAAAEQIAGERIAPVVILTAFSQRELVERARDAGAMAYLVKPFSKADLVPAVEMAVSRFAEVQLLEAQVADLSERLATRKAVDRAKAELQRELGISEPEAFRWIQKTAMDLRRSMRQVAEGVLTHGVGNPGGAEPG